VTTIYVTHDQVEAMTMGDRVAVMRSGVLQQTGDPQVVFDRPANLFVASFIGSPPMNLLQAQLAESGSGLAVKVGEQELPIPAETVAERPGLRAYTGRTIGLGVRPEHLREANGDAGVRLRGAVRATEALGSEFLVHLEVDAEPVLTEEVREVAGDVDAAALQRLESEAMERRTVVIARLETQRRPAVDAPIEVAVDTRHSTSSTSTTGSRSTTSRDGPHSWRVDGAARPAGGRRAAPRHAAHAAFRRRRVQLRDRPVAAWYRRRVDLEARTRSVRRPDPRRRRR
jgi:ABC-type sugar transport system ATPase subunit